MGFWGPKATSIIKSMVNAGKHSRNPWILWGCVFESAVISKMCWFSPPKIGEFAERVPMNCVANFHRRFVEVEFVRGILCDSSRFFTKFGTSHCFFCNIQYQLSVNWCFGFVLWIFGIPLKGLLPSLESQTTNPNHQFTIGRSRENLLFQWLTWISRA